MEAVKDDVFHGFFDLYGERTPIALTGTSPDGGSEGDGDGTRAERFDICSNTKVPSPSVTKLLPYLSFELTDSLIINTVSVR